jgi:hypothetical protein
MTKLTQQQRELLKNASARDDGVIEPAEGTAKMAIALIKRGLAISLPLSGGDSRLIITGAGRALVGGEGATSADTAHPETSTAAPAEETVAPAAPTSAAAPKGKIAQLLVLLRQEGGATVEAMMEATGWQAHSVRGALSGAIKKGLGIAVISEKVDGMRRYRIAAESAA